MPAFTRYSSSPVTGQRFLTTQSPASAGLLRIASPSPAIIVTITSPGTAGRV